MGPTSSQGQAKALGDTVSTLDTNAIIYFLADDRRAVRVLWPLLNSTETLYVSAVTELELLSYAHLTALETDRIDRILASCSVIPLDSRIARIAGFLRRTYGLKTADSAIAATALFTGTKLYTRNTRDFQRVSELVVLPI